MDPLSFSAGIAGLLGLAIEITKLMYEYVSGVKDAPKTAQNLLTETTAIENILHDLRNKVLVNPDVSAVFKLASMDPTSCWHETTSLPWNITYASRGKLHLPTGTVPSF
ncbi:hypothetical protein GQ44DRAFT_732570 [Phaeosphaeriaceae sp. PMI808]|nr:hypothetical protein GQ44DRAFT_732570 [Phaeosphaeriaceae sp. PMI808]